MPVPADRRDPDDIACPTCGEAEELVGEHDGQLIRITCGSCDTTWHRDPERRCPRCGAGELYPALLPREGVAEQS